MKTLDGPKNGLCRFKLAGHRWKLLYGNVAAKRGDTCLFLAARRHLWLVQTPARRAKNGLSRMKRPGSSLLSFGILELITVLSE